MEPELLDLLKRWCDLPIDALRTEYTFRLGIATRSAYDDKVYTKGLSRGDMIRDLVANEEDNTQ